MSTTTSTKTKLVRVIRREFYDAVGNVTYFLRVPEGATPDEIESFLRWGSDFDKGDECIRDGLSYSCVGRFGETEKQVAETLEFTGGVELEEITEITEQQLQEELGE